MFRFHAQKAPFEIPKIRNLNFWIENDPPPLELFRKLIRLGSATLPLYIETTTGDAVAVDVYKPVVWILKLKFLQDFEIQFES